jgi:hypothetical protein
MSAKRAAEVEETTGTAGRRKGVVSRALLKRSAASAISGE